VLPRVVINLSLSGNKRNVLVNLGSLGERCPLANRPESVGPQFCAAFQIQTGPS
jgi:hypothetical protein